MPDPNAPILQNSQSAPPALPSRPAPAFNYEQLYARYHNLNADPNVNPLTGPTVTAAPPQPNWQPGWNQQDTNVAFVGDGTHGVVYPGKMSGLPHNLQHAGTPYVNTPDGGVSYPGSTVAAQGNAMFQNDNGQGDFINPDKHAYWGLYASRAPFYQQLPDSQQFALRGNPASMGTGAGGDPMMRPQFGNFTRNGGLVDMRYSDGRERTQSPSPVDVDLATGIPEAVRAQMADEYWSRIGGGYGDGHAGQNQLAMDRVNAFYGKPINT